MSSTWIIIFVDVRTLNICHHVLLRSLTFFGVGLPPSLLPFPPSFLPLQAKVTEESSQYEFENYMRQQLLLAEEKNTIHEAKSLLGQQRHFGSVPPVRRLGTDAQPVSPLDAALLAQRYLRK